MLRRGAARPGIVTQYGARHCRPLDSGVPGPQDVLVSYFALPILAVRGVSARVRGTPPPVATGPVEGRAEPSGRGGATAEASPDVDRERALRVGVIGDSTVEGVGTPTHAEGFPGQFGQALADRIGRPVEWSSAGRSGATARGVRTHVLPRLVGQFAVVVILVGVNDVVRNRSVASWSADLSAILADLVPRADRIVLSGIPPMLAVPAFGSRVARDLHRHALRLDAAAQEACAGRATWVGMSELRPPRDQYASDRYHPSPAGYAAWARLVADHVEI